MAKCLIGFLAYVALMGVKIRLYCLCRSVLVFENACHCRCLLNYREWSAGDCGGEGAGGGGGGLRGRRGGEFEDRSLSLETGVLIQS